MKIVFVGQRIKYSVREDKNECVVTANPTMADKPALFNEIGDDDKFR